MKKLFTAILLGFISIANAQVIIGDATGTAAVKTSVLLEFAAGQNKGIIVPYVRTMPTTPTEGTILLDASTPISSRMKYYAGSVKGWVDLSGQDANLNSTTVLANFATAGRRSRARGRARRPASWRRSPACCAGCGPARRT